MIHSQSRLSKHLSRPEGTGAPRHLARDRSALVSAHAMAQGSDDSNPHKNRIGAGGDGVSGRRDAARGERHDHRDQHDDASHARKPLSYAESGVSIDAGKKAPLRKGGKNIIRFFNH